MRAFAISASGMASHGQAVDIVANNLANISTTGFKKSRAAFSDLVYQHAQVAGGVSAGAGISFGHGTRLAATQLDFAQGPLVPTGRALDVAIVGIGFFVATDANGAPRYFRSGSFTRNALGELSLSTGSAALTLEPTIAIPADASSVSIGADGTVLATMADGSTVELGRLSAARFINPEGLEHVGDSLFAETGASGPAELGFFDEDGFGGLVQGFLEGSNVEPAEELINLIEFQRGFEVNASAFRTANENLQTVMRLNG